MSPARYWQHAVWFALSLSCATALAQADAATAAATNMFELPPAPLHCRQRTGVLLAETQSENRGRDDGSLAPSDLRALGLHTEQHTLRDLTRWPGEPTMRASVDPAHLSEALKELCPPVASAALLRTIAGAIVDASEQFDVDPMLLGALIYQQSGCEAGRQSGWGAGLTMLNPGLLPPGVYQGTVRYTAALSGNGASSHVLTLGSALPSEPRALLDPVTNVRVAAALLRMYSDQCAELDALCGSVAHRHPVSHFIWGDRVRGIGSEDAVLTARRRLLDYYRGAPQSQARAAKFEELVVSSPLDGAPRVVTSGLGEASDSGGRPHAGIDFLSRMGEPVRAVADGEVLRAGVNLRDGSLVDVVPLRAALVPTGSLGARGLFVELSHEDGYRSLYAHLASFVVEAGDKVSRGQLLGYVGATGTRESDPHLHFGLFRGADVVDPVHALRDFLFAPMLEHYTSSSAGGTRHEPH